LDFACTAVRLFLCLWCPLYQFGNTTNLPVRAERVVGHHGLVGSATVEENSSFYRFRSEENIPELFAVGLCLFGHRYEPMKRSCSKEEASARKTTETRLLPLVSPTTLSSSTFRHRKLSLIDWLSQKAKTEIFLKTFSSKFDPLYNVVGLW